MVGLEAATAIWQTLMTASTAFVVLLLASFVYLGGVLPRLSAEEFSLPRKPKDLAHTFVTELVEGLVRAFVEAIEWAFLVIALQLVLAAYLGGVVLGILGVVLGDAAIVGAGVLLLLIALVSAVVFLGGGVYKVADAVAKARGRPNEKGT